MTLWFDVTDLRNWDHPHLTGIQRTVVGVLGELVALRNDTRLFAYDYQSGRLEEVDVANLPLIIREHLPGGRCDGIQILQPIKAIPHHILIALQKEEPPQETPELARQEPPRRLRYWLRRVALAVVNRCSQDDATRQALTAFLLSSKRLLGVLWRRNAVRRLLQRVPAVPQQRAPAAPQRELPASTTDQPAVAPLVSQRRRLQADELLFQPGDICLSLSASWGLPGYAEAIACNRRNGRVVCINLLYDLIPTLFPQWLSSGVSQMITRWVRGQVANADLVLTISEFQKGEITRYLTESGLPQRPVQVIRLGDEPAFLKTVKERLPALPRYVPRKRFAVCVSTLDVRKNHHCLYQVWRRLVSDLGDECPQLLLIGTPHELVKDLLYQIQNDRLVNRTIIHLRNITDEELAWYYKHCLFTVYPSVYEGWGLPVAESLALGRYCIASGATSIPEIGGDLVDYFDPMDYPACYRLVRRAATDAEYVTRREAEIRSRYRPTTWRMTAEQVSAIVDECNRPAARPRELELVGSR